MVKGKKAAPSPSQAVLLEPCLVQLRKQLAGSADLRQQQVFLHRPEAAGGVEASCNSGTPSSVSLSGLGSPDSCGCQLSKSVLLAYSAYYVHAASFGEAPPDSITLEIGHKGMQLLADALKSGSATLGPDNLPDFLQAASYLQVGPALDAAAHYLQAEVLESHPAAVLRVALGLGLSSLLAHIQHDFLQDFYMLSGDKAAALLKEWAPAQRRQLLSSPDLCAPTECCLVETLCHLAKHASSADAVQLLDCVRFDLMASHEAAAAALYVQHNAKWVDKRLSTAIAWRLLNARIASDLEGQRPGCVPAAATAGISAWAGGTGASDGRGSSSSSSGAGTAGAGTGELGAARAARRRSLAWGLSTARLASWHGTVMYCTAQHIACSWGPAGGRPMVLQLEREDPRHAAAEAVGGTSGSAGGTSSGGSGWDVQISLDPERFPAGFQAVCFAFGTDGLFWCKLGPLAKSGPTWWKVGFLSSQLPKALPQPGSGDGGGLLLVGWWLPEQ